MRRGKQIWSSSPGRDFASEDTGLGDRGREDFWEGDFEPRARLLRLRLTSRRVRAEPTELSESISFQKGNIESQRSNAKSQGCVMRLR